MKLTIVVFSLGLSAFEVCLSFYFVVVFSLIKVFLFPPRTAKLLGCVHESGVENLVRRDIFCIAFYESSPSTVCTNLGIHV